MCSRPSPNCARYAARIRSITTIRSRPGRSSRTGACSLFRSPRRALLLGAGLLIAANSFARAAEPGQFGYGEGATPAQIAGWDIDVRGSDGAGLPAGKGSVERGTEVFAEQCAACHGTFGEGEGRFPKLAGGAGTLRDDRPEPTVGSYWPFAPTLWDYINRAMPMPAPHTLSADDVYALTAYTLNRSTRRNRNEQAKNALDRHLRSEIRSLSGARVGAADRRRSAGQRPIGRGRGPKDRIRSRQGQLPDLPRYQGG